MPDPGHDPGSGITRVDMLRHLFIISLLALVAAVLGGVVAGPGTAQAQGSDIDLAVSISSLADADPTITLTNSGFDTAYAVDVAIEADNVSLDPTSDSPPGEIALPPLGSVTLQSDSKLIWSIHQLPGRSTYTYTVSTKRTTGIKVVQYVATVSSRTTLEPEGLRHDNRAEVWQTRNTRDNIFKAAEPGYAVTVAVDNRFPQAQGNVTFTIEAFTRELAPLRDAQVTISLPAGLAYSSDTAPAGTSYNSSTGIWTIGDWVATVAIQRTYSIALTATLAADAVLHEQCVTAEISANPPEPLDETANNLSTVCLGKKKSVLFREGQTDLLTLYSCTGVTTYPCSTAGNHLELVVEGGTASSKAGLSENLVLQPDEVVVHVPDRQDRRSSSGSRAWYTGSITTTGTNPAGEQPGVVANLSLPSPTYGAYNFAITDTTTGGKPGTLKILNATNTNFAILDIDNTPSRGPINTTSTSIPLLFEFGELGTYVAQLTASATHQGSSTQYSDTATYTFHVGPIAELAVRDAGPSPDATSSQRAFTIVAVNNGPDGAPAARVTVDLQGATVSQAIASRGSYSNGVWTLGELASNDPTFPPTLTLITTAPLKTPITATITNTEDYEVCISSTGDDLSHTTQAACVADTTNGGSWHTATYYDYISTNNTATVNAQAGTSASSTARVTVRWDAVAEASYYQIWRQGSPWTLIAEVPASQTSYMDTTAEPGQAYTYAVRAMDAQGIPVASQTVVAAAPRVVTRTVISGGSGSVSPTGPTRLRAASRGPTRILVYWTGPRILYGEAVTSYEVEVSHDLDHWTTAEPYIEVAGTTRTGEQVATKYTHTGLTPGTTYYYRVYAHNRRGRSLASAVVSATTDEPRPLTGYLENPPPGSFQSGVGVVHGWECDADEVVVQINGTPHPAVYGTNRPDTQAACGDTDNGFELLLNWNALGDGLHEVAVVVDGTELGRARVIVTTLGAPFRHGLSGTCAVPDFPTLGDTVTLVWQEARQNFVITNGQTPPTFSSTGSSTAPGFLENPAANTWQSGIGPLSGWVCDADDVTLRINGRAYPVPYGLERIDTLGPCGDIDNGFGMVFNWNALGSGEHVVEAVADGEVFDRATVWVKTLGESFVRNVVGTCEVPDFPATGETVTLEWQEAQQNFVITAVE